MKRGHVWMMLCCVVAVVSTLEAVPVLELPAPTPLLSLEGFQTTGTYTVRFTASPDHSATDQGGTNVVSSYALVVTPQGGSALAPRDLGKPTPNAQNEIAVDINAYIIALPPGTYTAVVKAIGPGGEGVSPPTSPFSLTVRAPLAPGTAPAITRSAGG